MGWFETLPHWLYYFQKSYTQEPRPHAYMDIRDHRFVIHSANYAMHVYGGIFAIQKYHDETSLGIPQPGKDVVLTPRSTIWSQFVI